MFENDDFFLHKIDFHYLMIMDFNGDRKIKSKSPIYSIQCTGVRIPRMKMSE